MSGNSLFLDTNIILYFFDGDANAASFILDHDPIISFITELELLSAPNISSQERSAIQSFLKELTIVEYAEKYQSTIIDVRRKKKLKLPDAIIAGTALTLGLPFVTADKKLTQIEGLDVIIYNPYNE